MAQKKRISSSHAWIISSPNNSHTKGLKCALFYINKQDHTIPLLQMVLSRCVTRLSELTLKCMVINSENFRLNLSIPYQSLFMVFFTLVFASSVLRTWRSGTWFRGIKNNSLTELWNVKLWRHGHCAWSLRGDAHIIGVHLPKHLLRLACVAYENLMPIVNLYIVCMIG